MLTVSAVEVDRLKAELQKQHAYIALKNEEIVSLSEKLEQAQAEVTKQRMQVAQLQSSMQANETSPEMQRCDSYNHDWPPPATVGCVRSIKLLCCANVLQV